MWTYDLPFSDMSVSRDSNAQSLAKHGDVFCNYSYNYLQSLYFYVAPPPATRGYGNPWAVIGNIVDNLPLVLDLHKNKTKDIVISDCGLVVEDQ